MVFILLRATPTSSILEEDIPLIPPSKLCLYVLVSEFLTVCYFLEGKHGGMCSPKIGEPSLATEGYEYRLWGMNIDCGV